MRTNNITVFTTEFFFSLLYLDVEILHKIHLQGLRKSHPFGYFELWKLISFHTDIRFHSPPFSKRDMVTIPDPGKSDKKSKTQNPKRYQILN